MHQWADIFIQSLRRELAKKKARRPSYSTRQFAKDLGVSIGLLSELLNGKRAVSRKRALKILEKSKMSEREKRRILGLLGEAVEIDRVAVQNHNEDLFLDWRLIAIAGLCELPHLDTNPEALANRLQIPAEFVAESQAQLLSRGLLKKSEDGRIYRPREDWDMKISADKLKPLRAEALKVAALALEKAPPDEMIFRMLTFAGRRDQIDFFKTEILGLLNRLSALSEEADQDELFQISLQLFPFNFSASTEAKN